MALKQGMDVGLGVERQRSLINGLEIRNESLKALKQVMDVGLGAEKHRSLMACLACCTCVSRAGLSRRTFTRKKDVQGQRGGCLAAAC